MTGLRAIGRFILQVLLALAIVLIAVFAVSNRDPVTVSFWPFFSEQRMPLYVATLGAAAAGLLVGGTICWLGKGRLWLRARASERRAAALSEAAARAETRRQPGPASITPPGGGRSVTPRERAAAIDEK